MYNNINDFTFGKALKPINLNGLTLGYGKIHFEYNITLDNFEDGNKNYLIFVKDEMLKVLAHLQNYDDGVIFNFIFKDIIINSDGLVYFLDYLNNFKATYKLKFRLTFTDNHDITQSSWHEELYYLFTEQLFLCNQAGISFVSINSYALNKLIAESQNEHSLSKLFYACVVVGYAENIYRYNVLLNYSKLADMLAGTNYLLPNNYKDNSIFNALVILLISYTSFGGYVMGCEAPLSGGLGEGLLIKALTGLPAAAGPLSNLNSQLAITDFLSCHNLQQLEANLPHLLLLNNTLNESYLTNKILSDLLTNSDKFLNPASFLMSRTMLYNYCKLINKQDNGFLMAKKLLGKALLSLKSCNLAGSLKLEAGESQLLEQYLDELKYMGDHSELFAKRFTTKSK
ncbi:MAG: hypothetical protein FWE37_00905 [Spirochaetaceae bacterium]|nr:hypothetical protein [Spirochaetaceae bacterium]